MGVCSGVRRGGLESVATGITRRYIGLCCCAGSVKGAAGCGLLCALDHLWGPRGVPAGITVT